MLKIAEQLAFYQAYHKSWACKATHFFGVPLVTFALLIPMGWLSLSVAGIRLTLAMVFVGTTLLYYLNLEKTLAIIMAIVMLPVSFYADRISRLPLPNSALIFAATFISGWSIQLIGHALEGKRPALVDQFFPSVFTAPLFLVAEALFVLGWGKELRGKIDKIGNTKVTG